MGRKNSDKLRGRRDSEVVSSHGGGRRGKQRKGRNPAGSHKKTKGGLKKTAGCTNEETREPKRNVRVATDLAPASSAGLKDDDKETTQKKS